MKKAFLLTALLSFPLTAFAAGGELDWKTFGWRVAMFVIFAALLYFLTAKRIKAVNKNAFFTCSPFYATLPEMVLYIISLISFTSFCNVCLAAS